MSDAKIQIQIFLSYAREDEKLVDGLYQRLADAGFKPWQDTKDILPGEQWEHSIEKAIKKSTFFIACLSPHSAAKRGWVQAELNMAFKIWRGKMLDDIYLIPVRLAGCEIPESLESFQVVDLPSADGWGRVLTALRVGLERLGLAMPARPLPPTPPQLPTAAQLDEQWRATHETYQRYMLLVHAQAAIEGISPEHQKKISSTEDRISELAVERSTPAPETAAALDTLNKWRSEREAREAEIAAPRELKAAFADRDAERKAILHPYAKPFILVNAPAGFGKTYLLEDIARYLREDHWLVADHLCQPNDTVAMVLTDLARQWEATGAGEIADESDFLVRVTPALDRAGGVCIQFDGIEHWSQARRWTAPMDFITSQFAPNLQEVLRLRGKNFKMFFAGRYLSDFVDKFPSSLIYHESLLAPFGFKEVHEFIHETLRRFGDLRGLALGFQPEDVDYLVEEFLDLTGGHPRAMTRLITDLGTKGFTVPPRSYFHPARKPMLFSAFVAPEIAALFRDVDPRLQSAFRMLSVFRRFNSNTLDMLFEQQHLNAAEWSSSWELYKQILQTHLVAESSILAHDRILQRALDAEMRFHDLPRYRTLHAAAAALYENWLAGKNHLGVEWTESFIPTGNDQVMLMVECLYHTFHACPDALAGWTATNAKALTLKDQLRFFGGATSGQRALRRMIENDESLARVLARAAGRANYQSWLNSIAPG